MPNHITHKITISGENDILLKFIKDIINCMIKGKERRKQFLILK